MPSLIVLRIVSQTPTDPQSFSNALTRLQITVATFCFGRQCSALTCCYRRAPSGYP
jgi:hypothetical protein